MSRTWKLFGLVTLSLSLLAAAHGQTAEDAKAAPIEKQLDDLKKMLEGIDNRLKNLEPLRLEMLNNGKAISDLQKDVKDVNSRINSLQDAVLKLDSELRASQARVARAFEPAPRVGTGTIRLQNRSGVPATVILGNAAYPLGAYETRLLENRLAGNFTYEVIADGFGVLQGTVSRTLKANEIFTIEINP